MRRDVLEKARTVSVPDCTVQQFFDRKQVMSTIPKGREKGKNYFQQHLKE